MSFSLVRVAASQRIEARGGRRRIQALSDTREALSDAHAEDVDASSALLLRASLKASRASLKDSGIAVVKGSASASPAPALRFSTGALVYEALSY